MKKLLLVLLGVGFALSIMTCGGSGDDSPDTSDSVSNTGAAVAAVFGTGSDQNVVAQAIAKSAAKLATRTQDDSEDTQEGDGTGGPEGAGERNTCDDPDGNGEADGPEEVSALLTGTAGTYGAEGDNITVTADDFCQDADGENSGEGTDGGGLFASYTLNSDVTATCDDDTTLTMAGGSDSSGIWRNTDDCFPEIFGNFSIDGTVVSCHLCLGENQTVGSNSTCSTGGSAVSLASEVSCNLSTEGGGEDTEDTGEGEPMGEDEEDIN